MKTAGLIGGTSWLSTVEYYRIINQEVNRRLGGYKFAKCIIYSIDHGDIIDNNKSDNQKGNFLLILNAAESLIKAGAEFIVLCANTTHIFADDLQDRIPVPLIHIGESIANEINKMDFKKVGLLGTKTTMEKDFLKSKLKERNIDIIIPEINDRDYIHNSIINELIKNIFSDKTRKEFIRIIKGLKNMGAEGIILGCTEIPLLIKQDDVDIPLFDTTYIHSVSAVDFALKNY